MASFLNKLVVINGAASGIGRATAKLLAERGALLSLSDINQAGLDSLKAELKDDNVFTAAFDVRSQDASHAWIRDTVAHFGGRRIDAAANLAGVTNVPKSGPRPGRDAKDDEIDFVWGINVRGVINCLRAELPYIREGSGGIGGGAIVNAASLSSFIGLPGYMPYSSSKHALVGITRTLAKEEGARAIRVNAIAPYDNLPSFASTCPVSSTGLLLFLLTGSSAMIATPMLEKVAEESGTALSVDMFGPGPSPALGRLGTSEEVAEVVAFLLSPQSSFINGASILIDGGMSS